MLKVKIQFINEKDRLKWIKLLQENYLIAEQSQIIDPKGSSQFFIQHFTLVDKTA